MLSDRTLKWVIDSVHSEANVHSVQQLYGGISSLVHGISLYINGEKKNVILRQFDNADWVREQPDLVLHEAESLRRASRTIGVQTPSVVTFDETGSLCGLPAVLMTRLEGQVVLRPSDVAGWLDRMARSLAQIHAVEANDFPWTFAPYVDASSFDASSWSKVPDKWQAAVNIVKGPRPPFAGRFIHRDFHPANVLWSGDRVSGVVDWVNGCVGPAGIDVGHCRVNLAQLYDARTADQFLSFFTNHAGSSFTYDPYWDLVTLLDYANWTPEVYPGWTALGVTGLTAEMMAERLDDYLISLLNRIR